VAFLDADDVWLPGHLSALSAAMKMHPEVGLVYDNGYYISDIGRISGIAHISEPHTPVVTADDLLLRCQYAPTGTMVRRSVLDHVGLFDEDLRYAEDHDLWLRIVEVYPAFYVPFHGFCYRIHSNQSSLHPGMWLAADEVLAKAIKRHPYSRRSVRKRRAVLAYRQSEIAQKERRVLRSAYLLAKAVALDPQRAVGELAIRLIRRLTPGQVRRWFRKRAGSHGTSMR
jgi:hypothetical protein